MASERLYKDANSLEMAVKAAARNSGQDTGRAIEAYYAGRFLERIFSEDEPAFVLKGGRGMLARTVKARYTSDTDLLYQGVDIEEAVSELKRLASIDLSDFLEYRFVSADPIAEDQEYRNGYRIVFAPVLGGAKKMNDIKVDLVVNQVPGGVADIVTPANRLDVKGLPTFDYRVYPVVNAMADKVCAIMQSYSGGRPSSRVRDLVDLVVYITTETFNGGSLGAQISLEAHLRKMGNVDAFCVPESWYEIRSKTYSKIATDAKLPPEYKELTDAEMLVQSCVDDAISRRVDNCMWSPESLQWELMS